MYDIYVHTLGPNSKVHSTPNIVMYSQRTLGMYGRLPFQSFRDLCQWQPITIVE